MSFYDHVWNRPYLTPSIAVTLLTKTPAHAKLACPFYGRDRRRAPTKAMQEGSVVDGLMLGGMPKVVVIHADAIRTKALKAFKVNAEAAGKIVMNENDFGRCKAAAMAAAEDLPTTVARSLAASTIKKRVFWEADGVACSTEPDVHNGDTVLDLKRTDVVPTAENWRRHCAKMKYGIQAAATLEATGATHFGWLCVEASPPHLSVVHYATPTFLRYWMGVWKDLRLEWWRCVQFDNFPGYESGMIDPMPYEYDEEDISFTE